MIRIPHHDAFAKVEQIHKGWSSDKKYYVETAGGEKYLLRTSDASEYEKKKSEFEIMQKFTDAGIKLSFPVDFGVSDNGKSVYQLLSWIEGGEALEVLETLTEDEQYVYGKKAADMLRQMEKIDHKPASPEWAQLYGERIEKYIERYLNCQETIEDADKLIVYLRENINRIGERPTSLMHEDFQTDNMVISPEGELYAIDFQMCGSVDPYLAMMSVDFTARSSVAFAVGQINGYFGEEVPDEFWKLDAFYRLTEMLYAYPIGIGLGGEAAEEMRQIFDGVVKHLDFDKPSAPDWYVENKKRWQSKE
ncbi:phosphotransferase [Pectobacterium peruviense]|uniref:aminoglycoside phosphotransferase family protein n=1 Tax=Pectobacterium peruviense TaxID=2066479 RepID=UPI000DE1B0EB|nr:phosphotransferase [Pectobacterium peruviense]